MEAADEQEYADVEGEDDAAVEEDSEDSDPLSVGMASVYPAEKRPAPVTTTHDEMVKRLRGPGRLPTRYTQGRLVDVPL